MDKLYLAKNLKEYLSLLIEDAMQSSSPLIRGLTFVDRRLGKRTLEKIEIKCNENEFVRTLYYLRCEIIGVIRTVKVGYSK